MKYPTLFILTLLFSIHQTHAYSFNIRKGLFIITFTSATAANYINQQRINNGKNVMEFRELGTEMKNTLRTHVHASIKRIKETYNKFKVKK